MRERKERERRTRDRVFQIHRKRGSEFFSVALRALPALPSSSPPSPLPSSPPSILTPGIPAML
jgi:hypothetical protein